MTAALMDAIRKEPGANVIVRGLPKGGDAASVLDGIKDVFRRATDDIAWLKPGETVLLKPALNSPDPYPATTHPLSIQAVAELLNERGAKVIVGDQSGIEHVLQDASGVLRGSSRRNFLVSGMGDPDRVRFVGFEERDWVGGFRHFASDGAAAWPNGFHVTAVLDEVDHIVSLPRLSTHAQAGVTLGFKNLVGLLREDSRLAFHANGPFNAFIKSAARPGETRVPDDGSRKFFEKMVEISLATRDKLRLTLFTATQAQVTFGPDRRVVPVFRDFFASDVVTPDTGLVFASADQVAAEAFALAFLTQLYRHAPTDRRRLQKVLMAVNGRAQELGRRSVWENPFIVHALSLGLGSSEVRPTYDSVPADLVHALGTLLGQK